MTAIRFASAAARGIYLSVAEGMWESARDDHVDAGGDEGELARGYARVMDLVGVGEEFPRSVELPEELVSAARAIFENCLDNCEGMTMT